MVRSGFGEELPRTRIIRPRESINPVRSGQQVTKAAGIVCRTT